MEDNYRIGFILWNGNVHQYPIPNYTESFIKRETKRFEKKHKIINPSMSHIKIIHGSYVLKNTEVIETDFHLKF